MAHPGNVPATFPQTGNFFEPDSWPRGLLEDFELGPIALSDSSQGLSYQVWRLNYIGDDQDPAYGDFILEPQIFGTPVLMFNVPAVKTVALAFDQNGRPTIAWELENNGGSFWYWYDTNIPDFTTSQLPAGSTWPRLCLDDHRETQDFSSDVILGYIRGGTLYYRQQRDRYTIERTWATGIQPPLNTIGMTDRNRVQYDVGYSDGVTLCQIVGDLCDTVGVSDYDVSELCEIKVRGYMLSSLLSSAEAIRGLQRVYFFDMPEIDGKLVALLKGRDILTTITHDEVVWGKDVIVETAREQEVEFPRKLHLAYACMETDYTPTKQTSERLSPDIKVRSEVTIEAFVNLEAAEAAQRADILHKSSWVEFEGKLEFALGENYSWLVPASVVKLEIRPGVFKRVRFEEVEHAKGQLNVKAKYDRLSAWTVSAALTPGANVPEPPVSSQAGTTIWEYMDLPALTVEDDKLRYLAAGYGENVAWSGAQIQREIGGEYQEDGSIATKGTLGSVQEALAAAPREPADQVNTLLVTTNKDLQAISDERLLEGGNSALVGDEIIQFRDITVESISYTGIDIFFDLYVAMVLVNAILRSSGSWLDDGFQDGDTITVSGSTLNDGTYTVKTVTDLGLYLVEAATNLIEDEAAGATITVSSGQRLTRLSYLLRGRLDTTPAAHAIGERFVLLNTAVSSVSLQTELVGSSFNLRAPSFGQAPSAAVVKNVTFTGESQREWAPIDLVSDNGGGDWAFSWTPRYRLGTPANPIKSAYHYGWRIRITKGATVVDYDVLDPFQPSFTLTAAQQTADFGGSLASPFDVDVMALNQFTGEGRALSETL